VSKLICFIQIAIIETFADCAILFILGGGGKGKGNGLNFDLKSLFGGGKGGDGKGGGGKGNSGGGSSYGAPARPSYNAPSSGKKTNT
jgi:hypothetical protein